MKILAIRHVPHEGLGSIKPVLEGAGIDIEYCDRYKGASPANAARRFDSARHCGLIVMGGPMNVDETERFPFLIEELHWIRQAVREDVPFLGICLGSQLLARAHGASVFPNAVKEIGWYEVATTPAAGDDPLLGAWRSRETVFQWHGDTFEIPPGGALLATGSQCRNQAFRLGRRAWGLQFHLEVDPPTFAEWMGSKSLCAEVAEHPYLDRERMIREGADQIERLTTLGTDLFRRFAAICSERHRASSEASGNDIAR